MNVVLEVNGLPIQYKDPRTFVWVRVEQKDMYGNAKLRTVRAPLKNGVQRVHVLGFEDDISNTKFDVWPVVWVKDIGSVPMFEKIKVSLENGAPV